ncbi:hypothetical protein Tco_0730605 [Tanacetum coccineum]|uniref:Uncharacterized protein n=1 Tax=Tanacetum coccineum TaxID=301880 RepID=A0ABQ4YS89_9ASTR
MSNTNMQTQTSNALHNAIIEAGGKDRPPMLAPSNYFQWKSRIKRYINTKPNNELIHYCLKNPPYKFKWTEKTILVAEGSSKTTTERYMENYKNVLEDIQDQLNAEAEAKAIERLKQGESINVQDLETNLYWEFGKFTSRDGESLESYYSRFATLVKQSQELKTVSYHKLYDILKQHQNEVNEIRAKRLARTANPLALVAQQQTAYNPQNILITTLKISQPDHNKLPKIEEKQLSTLLLLFMIKNLPRKSTNLPTTTFELHKTPVELIKIILQESTEELGMKIRWNMGMYQGNVKKPKRAKDAAYHKEQMILCKQVEVGVQLNAEQADWKDDIDDEFDDQELEAHYMYMAQIQEVTPDAVDTFRPIFDVEPLHKVQNNNDNYNVFAIENEHPEQPESGNDIYLEKKERDLLASLIKKLKCEIDESKNRNIFLETSNKTLVDKLKGEIEDFKTKNKSLESSNNHFKEENNELSKTNQLIFKDLKKFHAELDRYHDVNYASKVAIDCAKAKVD